VGTRRTEAYRVQPVVTFVTEASATPSAVCAFGKLGFVTAFLCMLHTIGR